MIPFRDNAGQIKKAGDSVVLSVEDAGTVGMDVRGTFTSSLIDFQATIDGTNWVAIKDQFNGSSATNTAANGVFTFKVSGFKAVRALGHAATVLDTINITLHAVGID